MVGVHGRVVINDGAKGCETILHLAPEILEAFRDHRGQLIERDATSHGLILA